MSSFITRPYVSVTCSTCKEPYEDCELGQILFDSRDEAAKQVTASGWVVDGESARCEHCALVKECNEKGHVWDDWWRCRCGCNHLVQPTIPDHVQPMDIRTCARCSESDEQRAVSDAD